MMPYTLIWLIDSEVKGPNAYIDKNLIQIEVKS